MIKNIYQISVTSVRGQSMSLSEYQGKLMLIVNTASKCGFTPQYEGLEKLYQKYKSQDFIVLAFPCNQFGGQEPGSDEEIEQFCNLNYSTSFPVFSKIEVNGTNTHPLFELLKKEAPGILGSEAIKWNFTKFLVSKTGKILKRYAPNTKPEEIEEDIVLNLSN